MRQQEIVMLFVSQDLCGLERRPLGRADLLHDIRRIQFEQIDCGWPSLLIYAGRIDHELIYAINECTSIFTEIIGKHSRCFAQPVTHYCSYFLKYFRAHPRFFIKDSAKLVLAKHDQYSIFTGYGGS